MPHRSEAILALLLPVVLACGGPSEPPANPPKIEAVRPTVEKPPPTTAPPPPAPSSKPR
jgi:hypothetical protein